MTDKELLELAADAVGIPSDGNGGCYDTEREKVWNPLTDDGDALRLAAKLQIWLRYPGGGKVSAFWYDENGIFAGFVNEFTRNDISKATRKAIVKVAASIGKGMKNENPHNVPSKLALHRKRILLLPSRGVD